MRITALVSTCALIVAGCGDSTSPDDSMLSFSYTGAGAANATTYSATGEIPPNLSQSGSLGTSAWAAGAVEPGSNFSFIAGMIPRTSTTWDFTAVGVARKSIGTTPIDPSCDIESTTDCTGVVIFFGFEPDGDGFEYGCSLTTGSVTISAVSDSRISGTFSGTGFCRNAFDIESPFTISNGQFDVSLTPQLLLTAGSSKAPGSMPQARIAARRSLGR